MKRVLCIILLAAAVAGITPSTGFAGGPKDTIKSTIDKVISVLKDPAYAGPANEAKRRTAIRGAINTVFDYREMAARSLAQNWKKLSAADKDEFAGLFAELLERSYINRIESYSDEKVFFDSETIDDAEYATVKTRFVTKRREEILVDYKMMKEGADWRVYDVVIERASLVNNYRISFNKIINSSSYGALVKKMKDKKQSELLVESGS